MIGGYISYEAYAANVVLNGGTPVADPRGGGSYGTPVSNSPTVPSPSPDISPSSPLIIFSAKDSNMVQLRSWFDYQYDNLVAGYGSRGFSVSGWMLWSDVTKTTQIYMAVGGYAGYAEFTPGVAGTYIDPTDNRMYVSYRLLWSVFGDVIDPPPKQDWAFNAVLLVASAAVSYAALSALGVFAATEVGVAAASQAAPKIEPTLRVIGSHPEYVTKAQSIGARFFQIPPQIWDKMKDTEQLIANQRFLDEAIAQRASFLIESSKPFAEYGPGLRYEIDYLLKRGYEWTANRTMLIPK